MPAPRLPKAELEAGEMRADIAAFDQGMAEWEADGRRTVSHAEVKRRLGLK